MYVLISDYYCPNPATADQKLWAFAGEVIGSFILCIFALIVVHETTTFIKSILWSYILIPVVYFIAREATNSVDGLNPSIVLTEQIFVGIRYNNWSPIRTYWVYLIGPMVGAVIAALFFNYFYLPLFRRWKAVCLHSLPE